MGVRRDIRIALGFAALVGAWALVEAATGGHTGLLYLAPALAMLLPLALGRYVGEERIAALAGPRRHERPRRGASVPLPRGHRPAMRRGGRLVGSSLAKRPPPVMASSLTP
jgi:hypothetical protein